MIEFIEETHTYLYDGMIIPSVSEILHFIFPKKYEGVDLATLNKKAEYGSKVHESIEHYENIRVQKGLEKAYLDTVHKLELDENQIFSLRQYIRLKDFKQINVITQEQMINYNDDYAGRFDMIARVKGKLSLCDIKTTAQLDKEYLSWQLSLYEFAYMCMYHTKQFDKLYAIWLPKRGYGELVEIKRKSTGEILEILNKLKKEGNINEI